MDDTGNQDPQKVSTSSSGLDPKLAALLSYLLLIVGGIVFIAIEKEDKYVRFHAAQSIVFSIAAIVLSVGVGIITTMLSVIGLGFIGLLIAPIILIVNLAVFVLWVILMVKAWNGEMYKLPFLSDMAEKIAG